MCKDAGAGALKTATSNRKRVTTLYAKSTVPESDREFFYSPMGHSAVVNKGIYQFPLPNQEVLKVGGLMFSDLCYSFKFLSDAACLNN